MGPLCRGPVWMPITPKRGFFLHANSHTRANPAFAEAWYNLADLLDDQGRSEAAIECLRKALLVAPTYLDAMFNLALLLQRKSAYAEAAEYWRRYLATDHASEMGGARDAR